MHTDADTTDVMTFGITDGGPSSFEPFNVEKTGAYGTLYLNSTTGAYKFVANDAAIEALKADTIETFAVSVSDGLATTNATVALTITATNDTADITGTDFGSVTEEGVTPGTPDASGNLDC